MTYTIGIDVGTSYTAAAVSRRDGPFWADPEPVALGTRSNATASVVFVGDDGQLLVGDSAERRALTSPERVIREFKRRLGDSVPMIVGGSSHRPEDLVASLVRSVIDLVEDREGGPAEAVTLTHPASWGSYKLSLIRYALEQVGLPDVVLISEPVAAAAHYAAHSRIDVGSTVAVYDLGGGTFDAAVVRKTDEQSYEVLGQPEGIDRLGGIDFDEAVFAHLRANADLPALDLSDPDTLAALARLRRECTEAKEALSLDTEATIPVFLPHKQTRIRLVRAEFEGMVRESLQDTIDALQQAIESAGLTADDIDAVLLVGGSSRIPLIAQLVSDEVGRPVAVDADPKATIALGAARVAASTIPLARTVTLAAAATQSVVSPEPVPDPSGYGERYPVADDDLAEDDDVDTDTAASGPPPQPRSARHAATAGSARRLRWMPAGAVAALVAVVVTTAAAFAWTLTLNSGSRSMPPAEAAEERPSADITAPPTGAGATSGAPSADGQSDDAGGASDSRTSAGSSPGSTAAAKSSATPAASTSAGGQPSGAPSSTAPQPAPAPTTAPGTSPPAEPSPTQPPDPPPPDPEPTPTTEPPPPEPTTPAPEPTGTAPADGATAPTQPLP